MSPALAGGFFTTEPPGKPVAKFVMCESVGVKSARPQQCRSGQPYKFWVCLFVFAKTKIGSLSRLKTWASALTDPHCGQQAVCTHGSEAHGVSGGRRIRGTEPDGVCSQACTQSSQPGSIWVAGMGTTSWVPGGTRLPEGELPGCPSHLLGIKLVRIPAETPFLEA